MSTVSELVAAVGVEGVEDASSDLDKFGSQVDGLGEKHRDSTRAAMEHDKALRTVGTAGLVAGGLLFAGLAFAADAAIGFDQAMSGVYAVSSANEAQQRRLRDAALEAGAATVYSASEAAQAEAELAKAGVSTANILNGGLRGALSLAAAGQLDLANAATITAQALNIFQLDGSKAGHVADVLAAGANKSAADVGQLGDALRQGGLLAKQTGLDLEDTVGVLALFADNALIGSDAGTSLKTMLQRLTPQSDEAKQALENLGISAYDQQGRFVGLAKFADQLKDKLGPLTTEQRNAALATIFGSDAVRAASLLYEAGGDGVREYTKAVNDQGAAGRMAAEQLDNLAGDLEQFKGSLETALIQGGSQATGVLRFLTQGATETVNAFSEAPAPLQGTAMGLAAVGAFGLTAVGVVGTMAPKVREFKGAIDTLTASHPALQGMLGTMGSFAGPVALIAGGTIAAYGLASALGFFGDISSGVNLEVERLQSTSGLRGVREQLGSLVGYQQAVNERTDEYHRLLKSDAVGASQVALTNMNTSVAILQGKYKDLADDFRKLAAESPAAARTFIDQATAAGLPAKEIERLERILKNTSISQTEVETYTYRSATALLEQGNAAMFTAEQMNALTGAIDTQWGAQLAVDQANQSVTASADRYRQVMADATATDLDRARATTQLESDLKRAGEAAAAKAAADAVGASEEDKARLATEAKINTLSFLASTLDPESETYKNLQLHIQQLRDSQGIYTATVQVDASQAYAAMDDVERHLYRLHQWDNVPIEVRTQIFSEIFGGARAQGGPVTAGMAYLVNENTPNSEIFVPDQDGYILPSISETGWMPSTPTAAAADGGGVSVHLQVIVDPTESPASWGYRIIDALIQADPRLAAVLAGT